LTRSFSDISEIASHPADLRRKFARNGRNLWASRKAVRKVIRTEATDFQYEREQQPIPRLGAWWEQLDGLLA
jgi:hypothetical protein